MNDAMKGILFILLLLYVVSPIDLCPGPIDDLILLLVSLNMSKNQRDQLEY